MLGPPLRLRLESYRQKASEKRGSSNSNFTTTKQTSWLKRHLKPIEQREETYTANEYSKLGMIPLA